MAAFPGQPNMMSGNDGIFNHLKRSRQELTGFAPSPSDAVYLVSPFLVDEAMGTSTMGGEDAEKRADAKAIMNDYVLLSTTGHCMLETMSRGIIQKVWIMSNNQRGAYFEILAQTVRVYQNEPDMNSLLLNFCKGATSLSNLGHLLLDAYVHISKNMEALSARQSPGIGFANRSPWTMYTTGGIDTQRQHSVTLDDRKWVTPNAFTPSLSVEQSVDINNMQLAEPSGSDDGSAVTLDKMNARKKTVSALNRMKQFVVPPGKSSDVNASGSSATGSVKSESPHVSPSMQSMSVLPNFPFSMRPSFPVHNMYTHPGAMAISHSPNSLITPPDSMMVISGGRSNMSPDFGVHETIVCRRKKPRVSDAAGPKGVSKTGSTWRIQVQVRGGMIVDSFGNTTERKKYRFSRYVSDYVEALWTYEVAILLSDRPKDLATQIENGNYRVLHEQKIVSSPDEYYLELGVKVSSFAHAERGRDDNSERLLAIQAYDLMKPSNGLSLAALGQSIANLGPMYSNITRHDHGR